MSVTIKDALETERLNAGDLGVFFNPNAISFVRSGVETAGAHEKFPLKNKFFCGNKSAETAVLKIKVSFSETRRGLISKRK